MVHFAVDMVKKQCSIVTNMGSHFIIIPDHLHIFLNERMLSINYSEISLSLNDLEIINPKPFRDIL